jgi:putative ABC transport system ATP-binding protein
MDQVVAEPVVGVEGVAKKVLSPGGLLTILDDISFSIAPAEAVALVGVSGSGKSTLLGLMAGLDLPTTGRVVLDGVDLGTLDEDGRARLRSERVGFVFQSFQLIPSLTALENVMLPLELGGKPAVRNAASAVLERVGLGDRLHHYPNQLSGGEQQRVAIARAFAIRPRILFAVEPTGNLDRRTAERVAELLFSLQREVGSTLVMVTHDESMARRCERILTLDAGRLGAAGNPADINRPATR